MPGTFSKSFYSAVATKTCADIFHPGQSCCQALRGVFKDAAIGSMKFYGPICIVPMILKFKKWKNVKTWKDFAETLGRCWLFGFLMISTAFIVFCSSYNIFKCFHLPTAITLPVAIGSLFFSMVPDPLYKVEGQGMWNFYVEFLIRRARSPVISRLRESKFAATLMFSVLNACVMFGFVKKITRNFWFTSLKVTETSENCRNCEKIHENLSCVEHWKKEMKQTAKFAFGIAAAKSVLPRIVKLLKKPLNIPKTLVAKFDYGLFMFFVSMNGIFKSLFCFLNNSTQNSLEKNCLISSLAAGAGYLFYPRYIVFTMAISNAIESFYKMLVKNFEEKRKELPAIMKIINKIPFPSILFMVGTSLDLQLRIVHPSLMNKFIPRVFTIITNGRGDWAVGNLIEMMVGFK